MMTDLVDLNLMESMLDMEVSMDILSDQLDRISLHSSAGSESRESGHSSSKYYDSAFDSHYSGDSTSYHSQGAVPADPALSSYHQELGWQDSPNWDERQSYSNRSLNEYVEIPQAVYRSNSQQNSVSRRNGATSSKLPGHSSPKQSSSKINESVSMEITPSPPSTMKRNFSGISGIKQQPLQSSRSGTRKRASREKISSYDSLPTKVKTRSSTSIDAGRKFSDYDFTIQSSHKVPKRRRSSMDRRSAPPAEMAENLQSAHKDEDFTELDQPLEISRSSTRTRNRRSVNIEISTANVSPLQAERLHMPSDNQLSSIDSEESHGQNDLSFALTPSPLNSSVSALSNSPYLSVPISSPLSREQTSNNFIDEEHAEFSGSGLSTPVLQSSLSSISISSGCSTPTDITLAELTPKQDELVVQRPLTPRVTILQPGEEGSSQAINITRSPRQTRVAKKGTVFYQDSLNPPKSPNLRAYRETNNKSNQQKDSPDSPERRNIPRRNPSILQRLIRKRGSFKQEGLVKQRLPVRRSMSNRITYHIKKGWIDYEEDLDLISQPIQPRAVGRMVDKKSGRFHMVQLYRPPTGKYGIYISETSGKQGVFISRFADQNAAKFYNGLISPGDQIVRVNGQNISEENSVDDVYDLMTVSDSVIFTVIPISMRSDW